MLLNPGSKVKVEVRLGETPLAFQSVVRSCDPKAIEILAPTVNGKKLAVPPGTNVSLTEVTSSGILYLESKVEEVRPSPTAVWVLRAPGLEAIRRVQRRREPRYMVDLHIRWRRRDSPGATVQNLLTLVNVNSMGALISLEDPLEVGEEMMLDLTPLVHVSGQMVDQKIQVRVRVVRKVGTPSRYYGVTFESLERMEKVYLGEALRRLKTRVV